MNRARWSSLRGAQILLGLPIKYQGTKTLRVLSGVCLWHTPALPPLPIRWVLVVDPTGKLAPQTFFRTQPTMPPQRVVELSPWRHGSYNEIPNLPLRYTLH